MRYIFIFAAVVWTVLLCSCGGVDGDNPKVLSDADSVAVSESVSLKGVAAVGVSSDGLRAQLKGVVWVPVFLYNGAGASMPSENSEDFVRLLFNSSVDKINGYSGNNLFGGEVAVLENGYFRAFNVYSTRRAGPFGAYEMKFLSVLDAANRIAVSGGKLKLFDGDKLLAEFKKHVEK